MIMPFRGLSNWSAENGGSERDNFANEFLFRQSSFGVIVARFAFLFVAINPNLVNSLAAQNNVDESKHAFSSGSYPWYDSASQSIKPVPFSERPASRSGDRNKISPHTPPANAAKAGGAAPNIGGAESWGFLFWLGLAVALVTILALLLWAFLKLESKNRQATQVAMRRSLAESIEQLPFRVDSEMGDFQTLAQCAFEAGDYRKATILLFSHVLVTLDQANLIRLRKGKTNRQYSRELVKQTPLAGFFQQIMESFEYVFFGDHDISRTDFEANWNRLPSFMKAVHENMSGSEGAP